MKTIYKFTIDADEQRIIIPGENAKFLHVDNQHGVLCVWCEVDPAEPSKEGIVYVVGTGTLIPEGARVYVGSAVVEPFVWHVYTD